MRCHEYDRAPGVMERCVVVVDVVAGRAFVVHASTERMNPIADSH